MGEPGEDRAVFVLSNRRIPGLWLIAVGGGMNFVPIIANAGVMPASPEAIAAAGLLETPGRFSNSAVVADPKLAFLGDIFAIPPPFPLHNVFSLGDLVIALGVAVGIHRICGSRLIPSGRGQFRMLLQHYPFRRLWVAQAISNIGDWTYALAVATSVADRGGTANVLATLLIAETAPAAVAGLLGGPLIDRLQRKELMVGSDVLRGVAVGSLLLVETPSMAHFYAVAVCLGTLRALFQPSLHASLPNIVPRGRIVAANALMSATFYLAVMIGPPLGGLLVGQLGATAAFAVNAASFCVSAGLVARTWLPSPDPPAASVSPVRDLIVGLRYSWRTPFVRGVFIVTGLVMFGSAMRSPLEPLFVLRGLGGDPEALGLVGGAWGLGMLAGSLAAPFAAGRWPRERLLGVGVAVVAVSVLAASGATSVSPVMIAWLAAGSANSLGTVAYESLLQERTPDRFRGRVIAASEAVLDSAYLLGLSIAGWMGGVLGIRGAFAVSGLILLATAFTSHLLLGREPRTARRGARPRVSWHHEAEAGAPRGGQRGAQVRPDDERPRPREAAVGRRGAPLQGRPAHPRHGGIGGQEGGVGRGGRGRPERAERGGW